jgi:hypothetical protein
MSGEFIKAIQPVLALLGSFAAAGLVLVGIAYGIFRTCGERWLENKFQERLAAYKHALQTELEQLKYQINTLMDRTVKLHQKEFEVLPEAWGRLTDAFNMARQVGLGLPAVSRRRQDERAAIDGVVGEDTASPSYSSH